MKEKEILTCGGCGRNINARVFAEIIRRKERERIIIEIDKILNIPLYCKSYEFPNILYELKQKLKEGKK